MLYLSRLTWAIDPTPAVSGDPTTTPQALAEAIADQAGGVTVVAGSANTTINTGGGTGPVSDNRAYGKFIDGITAAGTLLPPANQNANGDAQYAGGIQIDTGICLCTGVLDDEPQTPTTGRGSGVLGPNNGLNNVPSFDTANPGEIVTILGTPVDQDFEDLVFPDSDPGGGDATVLEFQVQISSPGFLRVSFVFGSDEHPFWVASGQGVNDSVGIIIDGQYIPPENIATTTVNGVATPFDLFEFQGCGPPLFIENDVAPAPPELVGSPHSIPGAPLYDIEFGGFTKKLTREVSCPLAPGTYTVKFVVQDVLDQLVDAAVFIESGSLKLFPLANGDYNGSGCVDTADYDVWRAHFGQSPACFYDGDGNGNGTVDSADYVVWRKNQGASGNTDFRADFDRDGQVGFTDFTILSNYYNVLLQCASRFEGDADGDGDVDDSDFSILSAEFDSTSCGCNCGESASGGESLTTGTQLPESPDVDGDGDVDDADFAVLDALVHGSNTEQLSTEDAGPAPMPK